MIVKDVERRKVEHWQWVKDGGQFVPGASVYLNQKRWNDDVQPIPHGAGRRESVEAANAAKAESWANK